MQAFLLGSGLADIRILTGTRIRTGAAILIGTDIMVMDPHFTGIAAIECTTRGTIDTVTTGIGSKLRG
jgi:NO-binding membrane sensor protein with MHYT domain